MAKKPRSGSVASDGSAKTAKVAPENAVTFGPRGTAHPPKKHRTMSKKAGLVLPVLLILRSMKQVNSKLKVQAGSAIYMTAVLEYLCAEVFDLAGNIATDFKKKRIIPRHLMLAFRNDEELNRLVTGVTFAESGVIPFVHTALLKNTLSTTRKEKASKKALDDE